MEADLDKMYQYKCTTCRGGSHQYSTGCRMALLVTSSQLQDWQLQYEKNGRIYRYDNYPGDILHMDFVSVAGATVVELHRAFLAEYDQFPIALDVVLVAGTNNLMKGQPKEQILAEMEAFKVSVTRLGQEFGHENTFGICTLFYPPKISRLAFDPRHGSEDFWNRTDDIRFINGRIAYLNDEGTAAQYTRHTPMLHHFGIKRMEELPEREWMRNYDQHVGGFNKHVQAAFRERNPDDMVHLSDSNRIKAGTYVVNYFWNIYSSDFSPHNRYEETIDNQRKEAEAERDRAWEHVWRLEEEIRREAVMRNKREAQNKRLAAKSAVAKSCRAQAKDLEKYRDGLQ